MNPRRKEVLAAWALGIWCGGELILLLTTHDWTHALWPVIGLAAVLFLPLT